MQRLTRWQKGATPLLAIVFLALNIVQPLVGSGAQALAAVNTTAEEYRMLQLVNQARSQAGLASLYVEQGLTDFARSYSSEMIQYNFFGHESPVSGNFRQRVAARGFTGWELAGENLATAPSVDVAFEALMKSAGHRENILKPDYNCIGIGVVQGNGCLYVTQEFMDFTSMPATADVPGASSAPAPAPAAQPDRFDSFLLVMNPNSVEAYVDVVFQGENGTVRNFHYTVSPDSRFTVPVRQTMGYGSFSSEVRSNVPVLAERAMYFTSGGREGGHDSIGTASPSTTWFFAEGYTGGSFDTWLLLQNPNDRTATVTLSFMRPDGAVISRQISLPANRRQSVHVDEIPGLESTDVSTQVSSDLPVVAERAMYFDYQGKSGGHDSIGASSPSNTWFFAEGYTGDTFDTWLLLQNPNDQTAMMTIDFLRPDGSVITEKIGVPGRRRYTVHVDDIPGLEATDVSTRVRSDLPVICERAMYFDYQGRRGGHVTVGAAAPNRDWYLAEGYTGGEFDEYVLIVNPESKKASVELSFMRPDGVVVIRKMDVAPQSRYTVHVDEIPDLQSTEVSTRVSSSTPVVVELSEYYDFDGFADGSNSIGACAPSTTWYFAEGCVQ